MVSKGDSVNRATGHLTLCFKPDGQVDFVPDTNDQAGLAERLAQLLELMHNHPRLVRCATGACDGSCEHSTFEAQA